MLRYQGFFTHKIDVDILCSHSVDDSFVVDDGNEILIRWGSHIYGTPDGTKEVPAHYGNGMKVIAWKQLSEPYKESKE